MLKLDILAIASHPDDVELSCAGTLLIHKDKGKRTGVVDLTRGELGSRGTARSRSSEATAAGKVLGLSIRENLGLPDGFFRNDQASQLKLVRAIRKYQPDIVLANAPEDRHPDHGRAAQLIIDSCFLAGLVKVKTELNGISQEPWRPAQVYHFIQDRYLDPDLIIDISSVAEKKIQAIRCFKSQFLVPAGESTQTYISTPEFFDSVIYRSKMMGKMIGVAYGEGFITAKKVGVKSFYDTIL
jgi:bacillithiol biosynthesis deacetylase BshB1